MHELYIVVAVLFLVIAAIVIVALTRGYDGAGANGTGNPGTGAVQGEDLDGLLKSRMAIQALLTDVGNSLISQIGAAQMYDHSLTRHRHAILEVNTKAALEEIEKMLLTEVDQMMTVTKHYRDQLHAARATIAHQAQDIERLREEAGTDPLTRIPNRGSLEDRIAEEIERAKRYETPMSLVLIDIDHFKSVNDDYGHLLGDRVLAGVAHVLDGIRRQSDFLARYGGEEFCMILGQTDREHGRAFAERAREKVQQAKFVREGKAISVTCSIGLAQFRADVDTPESLLARADMALYRAKGEGRNQVVEEALF